MKPVATRLNAALSSCSFLTSFVRFSRPHYALVRRNSMSDLVATTHLSVVDARFRCDPVWCLGFKTTTDVILRNYPEKEFAEKMVEVSI